MASTRITLTPGEVHGGWTFDEERLNSYVFSRRDAHDPDTAAQTFAVTFEMLDVENHGSDEAQAARILSILASMPLRATAPTALPE